MTTETLPAAIQIYPDERDRLADPRLDYSYIDDVAKYVANCLVNGLTVESCFQPGDGTCYRLVFTPLTALAVAPARYAHTSAPWESHAVSGCRTGYARDLMPPARYYDHRAVLVTWVENTAYPILLHNEFNADYVAQKFDTTIVSGCTLAILFRAIGHHYLTNGGLL